jgi:primosomal protein N' (replication factor Y)
MMTVYVRVAVNLPQASDEYDYHLPAELVGRVVPGCLVVVPFGRQQAQGVVMRLVDEPQVARTRPVTELLDPEPVVMPLQMRLAQWISEQSLAPLPVCIERMLPPGLSQRADTLYRLVDPPSAGASEEEASPVQARILALFASRGALRGRQIEYHLAHVNWRAAMQGLLKHGLVQAETYLAPPSVHAKKAHLIHLACPAAEIGRASCRERV